jgi:hypothetical protein
MAERSRNLEPIFGTLFRGDFPFSAKERRRKEIFMRKETKILEEKLERATKIEIARLSRQIAEDPELRRMLASPMEEIPQYRYLYSSVLRSLGQHSLFDAIRFMLEREHRHNFYFSKAGNIFTGFIVYEDNGRVINSVKMASFKDDRKQTNPVLAKDLRD